MDATSHCGLRQFQYNDGLYSGLYLVLRQSLLCSLLADVDQMDVPTSSYRPNSKSRMEILSTNLNDKPSVDGTLRRIRFPFLKRDQQPSIHWII